MSFAEMKEALVTLSADERAELQEHLHALEEGVSIQELRAMNAALDEALNDSSPSLTLKDVREHILSLKPGDAA